LTQAKQDGKKNTMFLLTRPSDRRIREFLGSAQQMPLSYEEGITTRETPPAGYKLDHNRIKLGDGKAAFERAEAALKSWRHFDLGWVKLAPENAPLRPGSVVAVCVNHFPLWSLNACRIIYAIEDRDSAVAKFGFAYGTLTEHAERGEERFTIEWDRANNEVWYDILAFSQPRHWLAKAGYPFTRWWQKRFAQSSLKAMVKHTR
jgi:uncharacterized protein (UPF0548 family)